MIYQYRDRAPFGLLMVRAMHQLEELDEFVQLATDASKSRQESIRARATDESWEWLYDDYVGLSRMAELAAELAIVGMWRTVEDFRRLALIQCDVLGAKRKAYRKKFVDGELGKLGIVESRLRCARTVDELRCLNNSIKHSRKVGSELADFRRWKEGEKIDDLAPHYRRLRKVVEPYLADLGNRLTRRWRHLSNKRLQRTPLRGASEQQS